MCWQQRYEVINNGGGDGSKDNEDIYISLAGTLALVNSASHTRQNMSPVINNTLKVLQTVVLSLDEQYVTNLRFTALENTLRAILNVCFKIV